MSLVSAKGVNLVVFRLVFSTLEGENGHTAGKPTLLFRGVLKTYNL